MRDKYNVNLQIKNKKGTKRGTGETKQLWIALDQQPSLDPLGPRPLVGILKEPRRAWMSRNTLDEKLSNAVLRYLMCSSITMPINVSSIICGIYYEGEGGYNVRVSRFLHHPK